MTKPCNLQKTVSAKLSYSAQMRIKETPPRMSRSAKRVLVIIFFIMILFWLVIKTAPGLLAVSSRPTGRGNHD